jgi:preprotein translocase subunit SecG
MSNILTIAQIITAILLMATILLQSAGAGLGAAFGGSGDVYATKRGAEKTIFRATIIFAFLFLALGSARLFLV